MMYTEGENDSAMLTDSEINFCISNTDLSRIPKSMSMKVSAKKIFHVFYMTDKEFQLEMKKLYKCCLKSSQDMHELHLRRIRGLEILHYIVENADPNYFSIVQIVHMTWCMMSCIHHFQIRQLTVSNNIIKRIRMKKVDKCLKFFKKMLQIFKSDMHRVILNSIIMFYIDGKLWEIEFVCTELIIELLSIYHDVEEAIKDILGAAEKATLINSNEAKEIMCILYSTLRKIQWQSVSRRLMLKFLNIFQSSILPEPDDVYDYFPLQTSIYICIRNMVTNLSNSDIEAMLSLTMEILYKNTNEEILLHIGEIAAYASDILKIVSYKDIPSDVLKSLILMICSSYPIKHVLGIRIAKNIIDRHKIAHIYRYPRIYQQDGEYSIKRRKCLKSDRAFFNALRPILHKTMTHCFILSRNRTDLEKTYQLIALELTEMPCGFTASAYSAVAMTVQEYAFSISMTNPIRSHHLHAIVLSLLSLICYIHKAEEFYEYVNAVTERRSQWAPHLNPPLQNKYNYAPHHILWNKPDLFFEDWETRYGLWKCFRARNRNK